jgi:hypothetical protein
MINLQAKRIRVSVMPRNSKGQRKKYQSVLAKQFCSKRRRRKFPGRKEFDADEKHVLASSELGSRFSQKQEWPEKFKMLLR